MTNTGLKKKVINVDLMQYNAMVMYETEKKSEKEKFKEDIKSFKQMRTIEEARLLAEKIFPPIVGEFNKFYINNMKCIVVNKRDLFRICIDSEKEFLCFEYK